MKCTKCGKDQAEKVNVCPFCGFRFPKELKELKEAERSTLIEFPSSSTRGIDRTRQTPVSTSNADWRAELSAKVRQVKERRNLQEARGRLQAELEAAAQRQAALATPNGQFISNISEPESDPERPSNPVVEAALKRVQRASEMAVKVQQQVSNNSAVAAALKPIAQPTQALPQPQAVSKAKPITSVLSEPIAASTNLALDLTPNETLLASKMDFEGVAVIPTATSKMLATLPKTVSSSAPTVGATAVAIPLEEEEMVEPVVVPATEEIAFPEIQQEFENLSDLLDSAEEEQEQPKKAVRIIKESDVGPNYLDELVAVCQQNLSSEKANRSQKLIAAFIDLGVITVTSSVFWATSYILGVNFTDSRITTLLVGASVFIGLVYLTLMVFAAARTLGMMFVGTRVINSNTNESPSIAQSLIRAFGYFLSLSFLGLGFIWMFLDHDHRTLDDIISSTLVVRDY
jgi:uncharacterized RDD family membrane protein YckC/predicted  nucleic acid-binding Zn-ribbon protein